MIVALALSVLLWLALFALLPWQAAVGSMALFLLAVAGLYWAERLRLDIEIEEPPPEEMADVHDIWSGIDRARERHPERRAA